MFNFLKNFYKEDIDAIKVQLREELRQEMQENLKKARGHCVFDSMFASLKNNGSEKTFTSDETDAKKQYIEEKRNQESRKATCDYYNKEYRDVLNLNNNIDYIVDMVHNKVADIIKEGNFEEYSENDHGYDLTLKEYVDSQFVNLMTLQETLEIDCESNELANYIISKRDFIEQFFEGSKFSDSINDLKVRVLSHDMVNEITHCYNPYNTEEVFYVDLAETYGCPRYGWEGSNYTCDGINSDDVMRALAKLHFLVNYTKRSFEKYNCVIFVSGNHCFDICTDEDIL